MLFRSSFEKKYDSAVYYFEQAANLITDLGIKENLATAYFNAGQIEKSKNLNKEVIDEMNKAAKLLIVDPDAGHYSDKEQAYAYLKNNDLDKALEHALAEYKRRPKNIDVNELMAWVYYARNENEKAITYLSAAMVTNSKNPALLCTAGLIYCKAGNIEKGKEMLGLGLKNKPVILDEINKAATEALQKL